MPSSDDVLRTQPAEASQRLSGLAGADGPLPTPVDAAEVARLKERAIEARMRTMELIARYLHIFERGTEAIAASREGLIQSEADRSALAASITRYALLLRALGEPPERTLILVKTAFNEAAPQ
jgi:hypothetical protein